MKRLIIFTAFSLLIISTLFGKSFPENNPELLLNKTVKPKEISESLQMYSYKNFFLEFNSEKKTVYKERKRE